MEKIAVICPWRYRDHFVPIFNEIWSKQNYSNYDVYIFEEEYTLKDKINKFHSDFIIVPITIHGRISLGSKLNYAFYCLTYKFAKYDYVMFASSDDYYGPEYINTCVDYMKKNNLDFINMKEANYINLKTMYKSIKNTSYSYSGMYFLKSELTNFNKYQWNEKVRAGEDRLMLKLWKSSGIKYECTNIHQSQWLGIIHGENWNTGGYGSKMEKTTNEWLKQYINDNEILFNFYTSFQNG